MSAIHSNEVIKATLKDTGKISALLADAFRDDPVMSYLIGEPQATRDFFESLFRYIYVPFDYSFYVSNNLDEMMGCALWSKPGQDPNALSLGFFRVLWHNRRNLSFSSLKRFFAVSSLSQNYHPKEPHYYLFAIGVKPSFRRQGVASLLLSRVLAIADEEQVPVYLENSKEQNLALYQKHNFEIIHKQIVTDDGDPVWFMLRSPQSKS